MANNTNFKQETDQREEKRKKEREARQKSREKYDADKAAFEERQRQMHSAASKVGNLRLNNNGSNTNNKGNNLLLNQHARQIQKHQKFINEAKRQNKYTRFHHEKLVPENQRKFIQSLSYHPIATARQAEVRRKYGPPKTRKKNTKNNNTNNPWKNWNWSRNNAGGRRSRKRSRKRKRTRQRKRKRQRRRRKSKRH